MLFLRLIGYNINTMIHEAWLPPTNLKFRIIGLFQRQALSILLTASSRVAVSIGNATRMIQDVFPRRRAATFWVPVGSNIPVVTIPADALKLRRAEIGVTDETPVVALFSPFGSGKGHELVGHFWKRVLSEELQSVLLIIGASEAEVRAYLPGLAEARNVHCVGYVPPEEVSVWLQSADLFLAPFLDGITTRRTSALSAMAHGLPTVTTRGHLFDASVFEKSPLIITDCDPEQFADAGIRLMRDGALRRERGEATRLFFERFFQWPAIAGRLLAGDRESIFSVPLRHRHRKNGRVRTNLRTDQR
jgi:glycosyltransferase involved in cell wall biosynthesis